MPEKRCHYDVLGLERDASDEDIKRAYRRLALFWHPDKNAAEDREDSSDVFRLITEAYAVLSDPKRKAAYDRDGHPPSTAKKTSAGAPNKPASAAGPTPPHPPTAPTAPASAHGYPSAPSQQGYGGWGGEGGGGAWQGMAMGGGYGQGWEQQQQQQQQAYPFQQGGYMQQQQQFQQQPGPFPPQEEGAFGYGSQYGQEVYPYPYQQQQQGAQPWAPHDAYNNYDNAYHDYGAPPSATVPPEPASGPPSTELALPEEVPQGGESPYPGGHPAAASQGMVAYAGGGYPHQAVAMPQHAAAHQGMMAPHNGGYPQQGGPLSYSGLPPAAWAPPSTNPPSSDSEESSDSESEGGDQNLAVARYGSPEPPESTPSRRGSLFRRSHGGTYPTETRTDMSPGGIIPRHPNKAYPRETRYVPPKSASQQRQHQEQERPGVSRGDSGLVLKLHMGKSKPSPSTGSSASAGALARRNAGSSRRGSEGSVGGLMQEMDRVFGSILGGSAFGAGLSVDMADESGSRRSLSRGFSVGGGGGGGGGGGSSRNGAAGSGGGIAATMMSSHTVVSGKSRTLFARTERTVVGMDGTRETDVQEYRDNRDGSAKVPASSGASESRSSASTGRRSSLKSFFGR